MHDTLGDVVFGARLKFQDAKMGGFTADVEMVESVSGNLIVKDDLVTCGGCDDAKSATQHAGDVERGFHDTDDGDVVGFAQSIDKRVLGEAGDNHTVEVLDSFSVAGSMFGQVAEYGFGRHDGIGGTFNGGGGGIGGCVCGDFNARRDDRSKTCEHGIRDGA